MSDVQPETSSPLPSEMSSSLEDPTMMAVIVVTALVGALLLLMLFTRYQSSSSPKEGLSGRYGSVLIYGPSGSGKTALFYRLYSNKFNSTQSSMSENILEFAPKNMKKSKTYQFVDFPGHGSQTSQLYKYVFEKYNNKGMKGMIFLIDIADTQSVINGAKMLYRLFEKRQFYKRNAKVLVLFNKKDKLTPGGEVFEIMQDRKNVILKEFNKLRDSVSTLQSINDSGDDDTLFLGKENKPLTWEDMQCSIQWGAGSVKQGQLDDVESFIEKS